MTNYFFDSSGLVKRYVAETGSEWVCKLCVFDSGNIIYNSRIAGVEVIAAVYRRLHQGDLSLRTSSGYSLAVQKRFQAGISHH